MKRIAVGFLALALCTLTWAQQPPADQTVSEQLLMLSSSKPEAFPAPSAPPPQAGGHPQQSEGRNMDRKWEVEFHGGGFMNPRFGGGKSNLVVGTAPFDNNAEATFFFGTGAAHANTVITDFGGTAYTPFDNAMIRSQVNRQHDFAAGMRISRDFSKRWGLEYTFDYGHGSLEMTSFARALAQTTATSAQTSQTGLYTIGGGTSTTTVAVSPEAGHQILNSLALKIYLRKDGRFIPYVDVGGGLLNNFDGTPTVRFTNTINFAALGNLTETDNLAVRYHVSPVNGVFLYGFGFKYYASSRWGVQFDVRDNIGFETYKTQAWAFTNPQTGGVNSATFFGVNGTLVFSNMNPGTPSTLRGNSPGTATYSHDLAQHHVGLTFGVFFRF